MEDSYGQTKHIRMSKALAREIAIGAKDKKTSEAAYIRTAIEYFLEQDRLIKRLDLMHTDQVMQMKCMEKHFAIIEILMKRLDDQTKHNEEMASLLVAMSSHHIFN